MQPAPISALCALHPGVPATVVCSRCGNFMCGTCSENGAQAQCPPCRALATEGFPFNADSSLGDLFNYCVEVFKRDPANVIIGMVVFFGITMAGSFVAQMISTVVNAATGTAMDQTNPMKDLTRSLVGVGIAQLISMAVNVVVQAIAISGYYRLLMDVLIGRKAEVSRMFSRFKDLGKFVTAQVLLFFISTVPMAMVMLGVMFFALTKAGFNWNHPGDFDPERLINPASMGLFAGALLLIFVVSVVVLPVTMFTIPELLVGNCTPVEALQRTWRLGEGQRLRVFGYTVVMGLISVAGVLACCVGLIVALPISYMLVLSLFLALRASSGLPPADHS